MTQRMDGDRRGLSSPVTPRVLIFACHSIVPGVDGIPLRASPPRSGCPPGGGHDETISDHSVRHGYDRSRLAVGCLRASKRFGFFWVRFVSVRTSSRPEPSRRQDWSAQCHPRMANLRYPWRQRRQAERATPGTTTSAIQVSWLGNKIPQGDIVTITSVAVKRPFTFDSAVTAQCGGAPSCLNYQFSAANDS